MKSANPAADTAERSTRRSSSGPSPYMDDSTFKSVLAIAECGSLQIIRKAEPKCAIERSISIHFHES